MLAAPIEFGIDPLRWEILRSIEVGPLSISPHGLGIAIGFLMGAVLMVRRSRRFDGPSEQDIWNTLFYCLLGSIVGARLAYVLGHFAEVTNDGDDLLGVFKVWEGGISLLGGIIGAVLAGFPYARKQKLGFWRMVDLAAPGLALGIAFGRIGDLIIGDHLGDPTDFALGWRCLGQVGGIPPQPAEVYTRALQAGNPPSLGCFDIAVHQTALYDFVSSWILLAVLLWLGRRAHKRGLLAVTFVVWYGSMRVITDFLRVDKTYFGLTGSQITAGVAALICAYLLARYRGAPPRFADPPPSETPSQTTESNENDQKAPS